MSDAVGLYHALVSRDEGAAVAQAEWLHDEFVRRGVTFGSEPMRSFIRPHFVRRAAWAELTAVGHRLLEVCVRVARHAFDGDASRLLEFLGTPEKHARWIRLDPGEPDVVLSRLDAFLTPQGPRFIEVNSDAPAGFGYGDRMAEVVQALPVYQEFARQARVEYVPSGPALVAAVLAQWKGPGRPTVAICDWAEVKTRADQEILRDLFQAAGVRCFLADPRELDLRGGRLCAAEGPIDVVYRRGVLSELVAREDDVRAFLQAYRDGAAVFVNSLRCHLSEDKAFFAVLTDEAHGHLMSEDERVLVARTVPWTRRLEERHTTRHGQRVDLVPWVIEHRDELVLKPAHAYGGASVYVGWETEGPVWEQAVRAALGSPWVVQERVEIPAEDFPVVEGGQLRFDRLKINDNPFYVKGAAVGAVTRASQSSVINVSAGGGSMPTFVVD